MAAHWLIGLQLLAGPGLPARSGEVLISGDGVLLALDQQAGKQARALGLQPQPAEGLLLAPALVDPHSVLEVPFAGRAETLASLAAAAAASGYGTVGLLPWGRPWRDSPELLQLHWLEPLQLALWASFVSADGSGLAPHADQLAAGALGLASGPALPPLELLERGLALREWGERPLLLAPRLPQLAAGGFVRESVHTLRAGWPPDPVASEVVPLELLSSLLRQHPTPRPALMNLSTAAGVEVLRHWPGSAPPLATVSWWHLLADASRLDLVDEGWRLEPSLGGPHDREALIAALAEGLITAVAVHHVALDSEEQLLPLDQRRAGVAGHGAPLLPLLWQELVRQRGWTSEQLWQVLCWQPAGLLGLPVPQLEVGGRRWLLFDPATGTSTSSVSGTATSSDPAAGAAGQPWASLAANHPWRSWPVAGRIRASGLSDPGQWQL
jgi:dihydroorotase